MEMSGSGEDDIVTITGELTYLDVPRQIADTDLFMTTNDFYSPLSELSV
jgi:hypothetical protein